MSTSPNYSLYARQKLLDHQESENNSHNGMGEVGGGVRAHNEDEHEASHRQENPQRLKQYK